jgi:anti-sigma B factor antagonist
MRRDLCLIVRVCGEMDYQTAPFFRARLGDEISQGQRCVVLDLSEVSFCDSAGLNVLLWAWRQTGGARAVLVLACVPKDLRRVLAMTGADSLLSVYDTVAEAEAEMAVGGGG